MGVTIGKRLGPGKRKKERQARPPLSNRFPRPKAAFPYLFPLSLPHYFVTGAKLSSTVITQ